MQREPVVTVQGLSKSFGGSRALDDVSIDFLEGQIHALVGENGAGKSTLIRLIGGFLTPDTGTVRMAGQLLTPGDVHEAEQRGISIVHQESTAFLDLTVEDNLFVGRESTRFGRLIIDRRATTEKARHLLSQIGIEVPLKTPMSGLSLAQRQLVAIARALSFDSRFLVMDEPSASLSVRETDKLHSIIRNLRERGISIVYVSHRLDEVVELADCATVLRDGSVTARLDRAQLSKANLIEAMVGRQLDLDQRTRSFESSPRPVLEVKSLTKEPIYSEVSFSVAAGEILGLGGLVGAGRTEVALGVFGIDRPNAGEVFVEGHKIKTGSIQSAVKAGIALVPEDRQHQGLVIEHSVAQNIVTCFRHVCARTGLIDRRAEAATVENQIKSLSIKAVSPAVATSSLSGGNQQKIVFAKWLATRPKVLILDEPTRGVDVGSKSEIHAQIRKLAQDGAAVVVISSDMPELLALSTRILVMCQGRIVGQLSGADATEKAVLDLAFGVTDGADCA